VIEHFGCPILIAATSEKELLARILRQAGIKKDEWEGLSRGNDG